MKALNFILNINCRLWEIIGSAIIIACAAIVTTIGFIVIVIGIVCVTIIHLFNLVRVRLSGLKDT